MKQNQIHFFVECTISEGNLDNFKDIARKISTLIQDNEPNTKTYQWYLNREGTKCIIHEVYPDSEVMLAHGRVKDFRKMLSQMVKIAPITSFYVLGDLTEEAKKVMTGSSGDNIYSSFTGFTR
jgi:quinol monooxygenase YgiN